MIFKPRPLSRTMLDDASLVRDKQHCRRIGPCGVGRRALYLNSYFIDRHYYVPFSAITRAFKFIEEGTGGVRGVLAGRACLLVEYDGGMQQVCCFKYEDQIDELLRVLHKMHPEIPCVSEEEEAAGADESEHAESGYDFAAVGGGSVLGRHPGVEG